MSGYRRAMADPRSRVFVTPSDTGDREPCGGSDLVLTSSAEGQEALLALARLLGRQAAADAFGRAQPQDRDDG